MSCTLPNNVLRKPLNIVEQPVLPFIQKDPPRFVWSKKQDKVNAGQTLRDQETNTQLYENAVLAVSRSENQTRYGTRSYIPKVNKNFRPPLIDPEFDLQPLSRLQRPRTQARTNPGGSDAVYKTQNTHDMDVSSMIDDRRVMGAVRPSFGLRVEKPVTFEIMPDLSYVLPQTCGPSRSNMPVRVTNENCLADLELNRNVPEVCAYSGVQVPHAQNASNAFENMELIPQTQGHNVFTNPSMGIDTTDYSIHNPRLANPVMASASVLPQGPVTQRSNTQSKAQLRPTLSYGSYHPEGTRPMALEDRTPTLTSHRPQPGYVYA